MNSKNYKIIGIDPAKDNDYSPALPFPYGISALACIWPELSKKAYLEKLIVIISQKNQELQREMDRKKLLEEINDPNN